MFSAKRIFYAVGFVALLLGLYGFYSRLFMGERDVNYGSYVNWGLWVAMYLFFAGMAAGSYMLATLDYLFKVPLFKGTGKYALWAAVAILPFALLFIGLDLGHMERIWKVYLQPNFSSLLTQLVWSYSLFLVVSIITLALAARNSGLALKVTMVVGLVLSIFVSGGVGALLGVNASRASLHTANLPAQFPIFNLTSGVALMLVLVSFFGIVKDEEQRGRLMRLLSVALAVLLVVKAYFLWVDYSQAFYSGVPQAVDAANLVLFGDFAWAFWGLQIGLGMLLPILLLVLPTLSRNRAIAGSVAALALLGLAVGRTSIIFPALSIPELKGLSTAFTGPHLSFEYTPSLVEWSVTVGIVGLAVLLFLLGTDNLPMFKETPQATKRAEHAQPLKGLSEVTR